MYWQVAFFSKIVEFTERFLLSEIEECNKDLISATADLAVAAEFVAEELTEIQGYMKDIVEAAIWMELEYVDWDIAFPILLKNMDKRFYYKLIRYRSRHPFHIVGKSPWPFFLSIALLVLAIGLVLYFHSYLYWYETLRFGFGFLIVVLAFWWKDVIREGLLCGWHTSKVVAGLKLGFILFIISEVMFFASFFWAFLHSSLAPSIEIGGVWPPIGLSTLNPFAIPLVNTLILLTSGATITFTHYSFKLRFGLSTFIGFVVTLLLAVIFTLLQGYEYIHAPFNLSDGIYASTFFLSTGFHGFHVIVGTFLILIALGRFLRRHFTISHHVGFEVATWYWHFVDVVWLFLFLLVYIWGSL